MMLPPAHAGHILIDLPIFLGPVAVLALWLLGARRRDDGRDTAPREASGRRRRSPAKGSPPPP